MTIKEIARNKPNIGQRASNPRLRRQERMGLGVAILGAACVAGVFGMLWLLYAYG